MKEEDKKNIDELWKEAVDKEKDKLKDEKDKFIPPEPDFIFFVTTLSLQASISLGQVPNPNTNKIEADLTQSKFLIDTLGMLKDKTKGNLSKEEEQFMESILYDLRMKYVGAISKNDQLNKEKK